jgi:hypothetical protein
MRPALGYFRGVTHAGARAVHYTTAAVEFRPPRKRAHEQSPFRRVAGK